jgi:muconolactone delta-isomerase
LDDAFAVNLLPKPIVVLVIRFATNQFLLMNKYQVSITFPSYLDQDFMSKIPVHRSYISKLIQNEVIDSYAISVERSKGWVVINAESEAKVHEYLSKSPLYRYFNIEIDQLMVYDSRIYRFPKLVLN